MSAIAALYNVPGTQQELNEWSFAHQAHHVDINRVLFQKVGAVLPEYVLDPVDLDSWTWLYQHQELHNRMDALLAISGNDLLDVNFKNPEELAGWVWLNFNEHFQAANILGIG